MTPTPDVSDPTTGPFSRWLARHRVAPDRATRLPGGASDRAFWRITGRAGVAGGKVSGLLMVFPEPSAAEAERWLAMQRWLERCGLPVPEVVRVDADLGCLLVEDLGDVRLFEVCQAAGPDLIATHLEEAVELLARWTAGVAGGPPGPARFRVRDANELRAELDHFTEHGLEGPLGRLLSPGERAVLGPCFAEAVRVLDDAPRAIAHRDFQSQNLMVTGRGLVLIDFQDACVAPEPHDAVALLRDSYVVLTPSEFEGLLAQWFSRSSPDRRRWDGTRRALFEWQTVQRKLKDVGRFEFLARVKGKRHFLRHVDASLTYALDALDRLGHGAARSVLTDLMAERRALAEVPRD